MTTTTRKTLETDKVVGEPVADLAVEQQGKALDEAAPAPVPWSELAPSDYAVLVRMFAFRLDEERPAAAMAPAVLAAVLALVETRVAHLTIEEKDYVFGLFVSRMAWVSKGDSQESWPGGSIELSLQGRLAETPVKVRDLVAGWIGPEWRIPGERCETGSSIGWSGRGPSSDTRRSSRSCSSVGRRPPTGRRRGRGTLWTTTPA